MKSDADKSRFLSLVLRHKPEEIGLDLDPQGWVAVETLLAKLPFPLDRAGLERIVVNCEKQRFALSHSRDRIRANQGHSVNVDLGLTPSVPPPVLFHGTARESLPAILADGLRRQGRHSVHLSLSRDTATAVGKRHGEPVVLKIDTAAMVRNGHVFYLSENSVWLTDAVPAVYLTLTDQ